MKTVTVADIESMSDADRTQFNRDIAKKFVIHTMALVWLKVTVPAVAAVCIKHAAIRAAKNL